MSFAGNCGANILLLVSDKKLITVATSMHSWVFLERTAAPQDISLIRLIGSQCQANLIEVCLALCPYF